LAVRSWPTACFAGFALAAPADHPALWLEDDEFPARLDLLFDSTCAMHLPTDIIWSIAMMSVLIML
jgi:hypothetical protein